MNDINKVYKDFWKDIFGFFGLFRFKKVKAELYDYHNLLDMVPKVYMEITGGKISKPNTYPYEVIEEYRENINENYVDKTEIKYILVHDNINLRAMLKELL